MRTRTRQVFSTAAVIAFGAIAVGSGGKDKSKSIDLKNAQADGPSASDLAPIFELGSKFTDLQRDAKEREIKGKVVDWKSLKVYEVRKSGDKCYRIQTSSSSDAPGTFVNACPDEGATKAMIEALKTGDRIDVKGKVDDVSLRNIQLDPALVAASGAAVAAADSTQSSKTGGPAGSAPPGAKAPPTGPGFTISKVKPVLKDPFPGKKGKYMKVDFSATAKSKPEKGMGIVVKFACSVGGELVVDKGTAMMSFDDMNGGETKQVSAMGWGPSNPLEAAPSSCTLSFGTREGFIGDPDMNLGDYCFTPPSTVKDGACAK